MVINKQIPFSTYRYLVSVCFSFTIRQCVHDTWQIIAFIDDYQRCFTAIVMNIFERFFDVSSNDIDFWPIPMQSNPSVVASWTRTRIFFDRLVGRSIYRLLKQHTNGHDDDNNSMKANRSLTWWNKWRNEWTDGRRNYRIGDASIFDEVVVISFVASGNE